MYKLVLNIHNYSKINIYTDNFEIANEFIKNKYKIMKTIPITDIKLIENEYNPNEKNSMYIITNQINDINYDIKNNLMIVNVNNTKIRILDFIYMILEMFVNDLSNINKYLIHSSCLKYDNDKSILLVGDANSGKSTLAYNLMSKYNMQLISNDHTLIGLDNERLTSFAGTKPLELRYGVIKRYFPEFKELISGCKEEELWKKKIIVNDHVDESKISTSDITWISDIYQMDLCENALSFIKTKDYIDQRLFLYEHLSKQLKGTYNLITGYDYPMPSVETYEKMKELNSQIIEYLKETNVHMCKGSIDDISESMVRKLERKK